MGLKATDPQSTIDQASVMPVSKAAVASVDVEVKATAKRLGFRELTGRLHPHQGHDPVSGVC